MQLLPAEVVQYSGYNEYLLGQHCPASKLHASVAEHMGSSMPATGAPCWASHRTGPQEDSPPVGMDGDGTMPPSEGAIGNGATEKEGSMDGEGATDEEGATVGIACPKLRRGHVLPTRKAKEEAWMIFMMFQVLRGRLFCRSSF